MVKSRKHKVSLKTQVKRKNEISFKLQNRIELLRNEEEIVNVEDKVKEITDTIIECAYEIAGNFTRKIKKN